MTAPETRWTAETEELVAASLRQYNGVTWRNSDCDNAAESILKILAVEGVLLPPGGVTSEDYNRYSERVGEGPWRDVHAVRNVTTWPDGAKLTGPWIEVPS
jgi:hypothetical protein